MSRASLTSIQFEYSQAGFLVTYMPSLVGWEIPGHVWEGGIFVLDLGLEIVENLAKHQAGGCAASV
jgi:hypothetical protein